MCHYRVNGRVRVCLQVAVVEHSAEGDCGAKENVAPVLPNGHGFVDAVECK